MCQKPTIRIILVWATQGVCSIQAVMQMAEKAMHHELRQYTLADLAKRTTDKTHVSYGIQVIKWLLHSSASRGINKDR